MIKLVCEKCNHVWYTANTRDNQKCGECGGCLMETELIAANKVESTPLNKKEKKTECKVIHVEFK